MVAGIDEENSVEIVAVLTSIALICWVLVDSFETIVVPRRVVHKFRFARLYYRTAWHTWRSWR